MANAATASGLFVEGVMDTGKKATKSPNTTLLQARPRAGLFQAAAMGALLLWRNKKPMLMKVMPISSR